MVLGRRYSAPAEGAPEVRWFGQPPGLCPTGHSPNGCVRLPQIGLAPAAGFA